MLHMSGQAEYLPHQPGKLSSHWGARFVRYCLIALATGAALFGQPPSRLIVNGLTASPDGRSATFWSSVTPDGALQTGSTVYVLGPGGLRRLPSPGLPVETQTAQHQPSDYALSPDGAHLAVSSDSGFTITDMATGETRAIPGPGLGYQMHFTSDGGTVLFTIAPFTGHYWFPYLYSVPASGSAAVRLVRGALDGRHPIAADGTVAFTSLGPANDIITAPDAVNLYTMKADGAGIAQLTHYSGPSYQTESASQASISADGKRILFVTNSPTVNGLSTTTVWVMQADGTGLRALPADPRLEVVTFSADGTRMAWSRAGIVHVQNVDTGDDRVYIEFAESDIAEMDFTPDNSRLYLLLGQPSAFGFLPVGGALWSLDLAARTAQPLYAPRTLSPAGIASSNFLTPGGFVTAYGTNLIPLDALLVPTSFPLPQTLGGVGLTINGRAVPMLAVTPWQANAQIPMETPLGPASVALQFADGSVTPLAAANVVGASPAQFSTQTGCAFHGGTNIVADQANPAVPGEVLVVYGVGFGVTNPTVPAGVPTPLSPLSTVVGDFAVYIGLYPFDQQAKVLFAGLSPGSVGLYQVNFQLPLQTPSGNARVDFATKFSGRSGGCSVTVGQ